MPSVAIRGLTCSLVMTSPLATPTTAAVAITAAMAGRIIPGWPCMIQDAWTAATLTRLATDKSIDAFYQQAALLLSVMNAADGANAAELQARLLPLTGAAGGWQGLALEHSAALDLQAGNTAAAKAKLEQVLGLSEIPSDLRQRVARMVNILES